MRNKRAFTLIELLVVVVVIVILMSIVFRIATVGDSASQRNTTINRMQRLENCLSGYYAVYGSYPPVKVHGSRDFRYHTNDFGVQRIGKDGGFGSDGESDDVFEWKRIKAACKSQPIAMEFPPSHIKNLSSISQYAKRLRQFAQSGNRRYAYLASLPVIMSGFDVFQPSMLTSEQMDSKYWTDAPVFKFGVLSYLLPRNLIALDYDAKDSGNATEMSDFFDDFRQWKENNSFPGQFVNGVPYKEWDDVVDDVVNKRWQVALLPSQAVCARWLPNLKGMLRQLLGRKIELYGVQIICTDDGIKELCPRILPVYPAKDPQGDSCSQLFLLDRITCRDGFVHDENDKQGEEFYYYSLPPYQSYRLWSAGPDRQTFPPWVDLNTLKAEDRKKAVEWMKDDIVHMSH